MSFQTYSKVCPHDMPFFLIEGTIVSHINDILQIKREFGQGDIALKYFFKSQIPRFIINQFSST